MTATSSPMSEAASFLVGVGLETSVKLGGASLSTAPPVAPALAPRATVGAEVSQGESGPRCGPHK